MFVVVVVVVVVVVLCFVFVVPCQDCPCCIRKGLHCCISLSFVSLYLLISSQVAWLTHLFVSGMIFNLHAFGDFPSFFLGLI